MIKPKPRPSATASRATALAVTATLLLGGWLGLKELAVPAFASGRDVIRELDPLLFQRYAAPAPPEGPAPDADQPEEDPEPSEEPAEVVSFDQEVGAAMEELERMFASEEPAVPAAERSEGSAQVEGSGIAENATDERFEALFGSGDELAVPGGPAARPGRAGGQREGIGLGITERSGATPEPDETRADPGAPAPILDAITETRREAAAESEVVIGDFEAESFDGSAADLLAAWMRDNEASLPVGIRAHVNFQPSFLTSAVPISGDGRDWELFLMFNESLQELHIVLVEGDRSIYMIDRGFQEESRSLREGTVRRLEGEIVAVDSRTASASTDRAQDFYNVFLSWWETVKDDVGPS